MSWIKPLLIIPPISIGVGAIYLATQNRQEPVQFEVVEPSTVARVITVRHRSYAPQISGFGIVEPTHTWEAIPQVSGRVIEVDPNFIRGGFIEAGTPIIRLSPIDYELEIAEAMASIEGTNADIEELNLTRETLQLSLDIQREALVIEQAELERRLELQSRGVTAARAVEEQQAAVLQQRAAIQDLENELALLPARLRALETSRTSAEVALEVAELNLERTVLRLPFDARVAEADVEIAQFVTSGNSVGLFDGIASAEINVQIPQNQIRALSEAVLRAAAERGEAVSRLRPDFDMLRASVRLVHEQSDFSWSGRVVRISDTVDPETRSIGIIVEVSDPYGRSIPSMRPPLVKGMFAEVELSAPPIENAVLIPRSAVREGEVSVVDEENRLQRVAVTVAFVENDVLLISEGLSLGDQVLVSDLTAPLPGLLLRPVHDVDVEDRLDQMVSRHDETDPSVTAQDTAE